MAPKPVKSHVVSATKASNYRRVSHRISSAFTPVQTNAARMRATQKVVRARLAPARIQLRNNPRPNHSPFFGMYNALQRYQRKTALMNQASYAKKRSTRSMLQLGAGNWARTQAAIRSSRAQGRATYAKGTLKGMQKWTTQDAPASIPQAISHVTTRTRNTSAAARAAQSRRAQVANRSRKGKSTKRGGGSSGRAVTSAPSINRSRSRSTRGMHPSHPVMSPKAAMISSPGSPDPNWVTAGNNTGTENCAAVALANHLMYHTGIRMTVEQVHKLAAYGPKIYQMLSKPGRWEEIVDDMWPVVWTHPLVAGPGDIVCYRVGKVDHAALLLDNRAVVSWGQEIPLEYVVMESWHLRWRTYRQSGRR